MTVTARPDSERQWEHKHTHTGDLHKQRHTDMKKYRHKRQKTPPGDSETFAQQYEHQKEHQETDGEQ